MDIPDWEHHKIQLQGHIGRSVYIQKHQVEAEGLHQDNTCKLSTPEKESNTHLGIACMHWMQQQHLQRYQHNILSRWKQHPLKKKNLLGMQYKLSCLHYQCNNLCYM